MWKTCFTAHRISRSSSSHYVFSSAPSSTIVVLFAVVASFLLHKFASCTAGCTGCSVSAQVRVHEPVIEGKSVTMDCLYDLAGGTLYSINWRFEGKEFLRLLRPFHLPPAAVMPTSTSSTLMPPIRKSSRGGGHGKNEYGRSRSRDRVNGGISQQQQYSQRRSQRPVSVTTASTTEWTMNHVFTPVAGVDVDERLSVNGSAVVLRNVTIGSLGEYSCEITRDSPTFESVQGVQRLQFSSGSLVKSAEPRLLLFAVSSAVLLITHLQPSMPSISQR